MRSSITERIALVRRAKQAKQRAVGLDELTTAELRELFATEQIPVFQPPRSPAAKLTDAQVRRMRQLRAEGMCYRELGGRFGVKTATAHAICTYRSYRSVSRKISGLALAGRGC